MRVPSIILRLIAFRQAVFLWALVLGVFILGLSALPAKAELVILTDGDFYKVKAYQLEGERMALDLFAGGRVTLPLSRIDRVIDDEVLPEPDPVEVPEEIQALELRFDESHVVPDLPFGDLIYQASKSQGLNPRLVAAVIRAESAFDHRAISPKGARGLMQLMPATAQRFGVRQSELYEPARNLKAGTSYLSWLVDHFDKNLPKVLAAYNAGEGAVARYDGVPPYRETRTYIRRIYSTLSLPMESLEGIL
ncbi:MAG: lytic transglycosylase domain-containing protein [Deltaproteobacteria bacterium]|nr:lytic transglycosylase domain-containing protein [Deltaproteobacteria bacterium]